MADISPTARPVYMGAHVKVVPTVALKDKNTLAADALDAAGMLDPEASYSDDPPSIPQAPLSPSSETEEPSKSKSQTQTEKEETELNPDTPGPLEG